MIQISAYSKGYYVSHCDERLERFSDYHYSRGQSNLVIIMLLITKK